MLEIAVCDDTREECEAVMQCAEQFFKEREIPAKIDSFENMDYLLKSGKTYDLYLLDVLMPGMDGIEGAALLGKREERPLVVFITSSMEAAIDGYRVNAAGFILKPLVKADLYETMDRVMGRYLGIRQAFIQVIHNRVPVKLSLERILWFENRLHRVFVVLKDGEVLTTGQKLSAIQEELEHSGSFIRCHQSFLVNLEHVERLEDGCFYMDQGGAVPISRNLYKQSKNAYYHYRLS